MKSYILLFTAILFAFGLKKDAGLSIDDYKKLSEDEKRSVSNAINGIDVLDNNLDVSLFAAEPQMTNPTNMDVDHKGRIWICEAYNYRNKLNPRNPYNKKGDRILILEDTNSDGKADKETVFYQGEDINSALGIAVLGNKTYVSCSPNLFVFTDENGDDVPDKKEILFSGVKGNQHDHGLHAVIFGHDGKLYFNFGNAGEGILDKNGNPVKDDKGNLINNAKNPYQEGMVFRCDEDGSNLEILGWNFRNNYEMAQDSYGRMWQSDNDDDGNRGTRINYVMDYGNYGFKDEITGADWRVRRTNWEDSIPQRHWHLNDPGVVPNMLQTYAGSPTGILIYEGDLLPKTYQNNLIHCDPGPNVVRSYAIAKNGAGFSASINGILDGSKKDNWFRPSDVTAAPDGSIYVSDWYDPGVGGHAMGDSLRGRVFRVAPKNSKYIQPKLDLSTESGAITALQSPNQSTRYLGYKALAAMGPKSAGSLQAQTSNQKTHLAARAYWLLAASDSKYVLEAAEKTEEDLRVLSVRMARLYLKNPYEFYKKMAKDPSIQVRREVALAIRHKGFTDIWTDMALAYDGKDRWYLEALGIAANKNWDASLDGLKAKLGDKWLQTANIKEIVWRSRGTNTTQYLSQIIKNSTETEKPKYYRAFDFQNAGDKNIVLLDLLKSAKTTQERVLIFKHFDQKTIQTNPQFLANLPQILKSIDNEKDYLDIVSKFKVKSEFGRLQKIILTSSNTETYQEAAEISHALFGAKGLKNELLQKKNNVDAIKRFGSVDKKEVTDELVKLFMNPKNTDEVRKTALSQMVGWNSEEVLYDLLKKGTLPAQFNEEALNILKRTWHSDIRSEVNKLVASANGTINTETILNSNGNITKGAEVYNSYCSTCHLVKNQGNDFGPNLSQIGSKLSKASLLNAILYPTEGISFGYEGFNISMKNGETTQGMITSRTEIDLMVKYAGSSKINILKLKDVAKIEPMTESIMPKFTLSQTELTDLTSYLEKLK
jgi:putative membrane-bound dehydrogenase-like protein